MSEELVGSVRETLRGVIDAELGHNIVDLGFVYDVTVFDGNAHIVMTATTKGCPAAAFLRDGAANAALRVSGIRSGDVVMTFEPAWNPSLIEPATKATLGF
jgi:metal-sulfur cluster biosynthetic enzyme